MEPKNLIAIEHWKNGAIEELGAARSLLEAGHYRQSLFWSHLAAEKALKAHVIAKGIAPLEFIHSDASHIWPTLIWNQCRPWCLIS